MKILKSPLIILLFTFLGVLIGFIADTESVNVIEHLGDLYLDIIQLTVIPILVSSIVSSVSQLVQDRGLRSTLKRVALVFILTATFMATLSMIFALIVEPGKLSSAEQVALGKIIEDSGTNIDLETSISNPRITKEKGTLLKFLNHLISANIFESLAFGQILEIVFFCLIFGISLGVVGGEENNLVIKLSTEIFLSFQKIISWIMYLLPFGLFALIAKQVASTGIQTLVAMLKYLITFFSLSFIIIILNSIVIWKRSKVSLKESLNAVLDPIIIALTTRNSFACIPVSIESLSKKLSFNSATVNLLIPLGFTLARYGSIIYFSLAAIFIAQVYGVSLTFSQILLFPIAAVLAGMATSGSSGFASLPALAIIVKPLDLPLEAILIVFYVIEPIIDPVKTLLIVHTNIMSVTLIAKLEKRKEKIVVEDDEKEEELDVTQEVQKQMKENILVD